MPFVLEQGAQRRAHVRVILDDEDPARLDRPLGGLRHRFPDRVRGNRQAQDELGTTPGALAARLHAAAMQAGEALDEREPDTEAALPAVEARDRPG